MITIKLTFHQLIYLHDAHEHKHFDASGPYYQLLRAHCIDFCDFYDRLIQKGAKNYRVKFSRLQAFTFMQLWLDQPLPQNNGAYVILEMIKQFDLAGKQIKYLQNGTVTDNQTAY